MRGGFSVAVFHIDSPENRFVKQASLLLNDRKARGETGLAVIENEVMLREALSAGVKVKQAFFGAESEKKFSELIGLSEDAGADVFITGDRAMRRLTALETSRGVSAVIDTASLPKLKIGAEGKYIVCEKISDPGNAGTILRTADAMGFNGVIFTPGSVDPYSPKTVRATMGSLFRVPTACGQDLGEIFAELSKNGIRTIAAVLDENAVPADEIKVSGGVAVFIGNEAAGLTPQTVDMCDLRAYVPMTDGPESLNAAVAAAIFMWIYRKK